MVGGAVGAGLDTVMFRRITKNAEKALPPLTGGAAQAVEGSA